jgi:fructokinase
MEMWVSGTGIALDYMTVTGKMRTAPEIFAGFAAGEREASAAIERFEDRLARGLAQVINILDPDAIVIGGGVSNVENIYRELPKKVPRYVFGAEVSTPILQAKHGDSSGVRGAAWLWPSN